MCFWCNEAIACIPGKMWKSYIRLNVTHIRKCEIALIYFNFKFRQQHRIQKDRFLNFKVIIFFPTEKKQESMGDILTFFEDIVKSSKDTF